MTTEYLVWHAFKETPATATRVQAPSSFEARKKRAAEAGVPYTELAARKWKPTASEQPQHVYEFDVKLFTRVTVTAASEAAARAMIPEMIDGEQDGDADLIEVDGKDVG
jgi:alpha-N-acetylglucosamine transferase